MTFKIMKKSQNEGNEYNTVADNNQKKNGDRIT